MEKFKKMFESKGKYNKGDSITVDGDTYKITDIINDEMAGLWVYEVRDEDDNEMTLDLKYVDKKAKKK